MLYVPPSTVSLGKIKEGWLTSGEITRAPASKWSGGASEGWCFVDSRGIPFMIFYFIFTFTLDGTVSIRVFNKSVEHALVEDVDCVALNLLRNFNRGAG